MGCACGKPSSNDDSNPSRRPPAPLPVAAGSLQAPAPGNRPAAAGAVSSLRREGVADAGTGFRVDAGAVAPVEKKHQSGPIRVSGQKVERRMERHLSHPRLPVPGGVPKAAEGEQVTAGWPAWLVSVAGEAVRGWIPRRGDSFEKLDKIGQGTYSNVYRARDLDFNKIVALKKVRFDNMEPESVKFMAREILILRRLDHPNIIKLEGLVTSRVSCSLYLVFEYMEHDLAGLASIRGQKFHEPQVKCYIQQLLHGLDHCHSRGILHRDIKGSNLLIDNSGILKIADFGLASFFDPNQGIPLTSRVVTLWYRPPELLLGATNYGVAVDLWSTGCILAELYAGKPIMPGRTEVEQLHKIFKLCGSPSEDYWRKSKLPHATIFKPQQPYRRCVAEAFKDFPVPALVLMEILLSVDPADRGTAASALKSEFFTTKPLACDPSSLPKYPPSKELDAKRRDEEIRRQGVSGTKVQRVDLERRGQREPRAIPAPDANAELVSSMHKRQGQTNSRSTSEKFNPHQDDLKSGFLVEPPRGSPVLEPIIDSSSYYSHKASHSGPLVHRSQLPRARKDEEDVHKASAVGHTSSFSGLVATRRKVLTNDGRATFVTRIEGGPSAGRLSESGNEPSDGRKYDQMFHHRDDERSSTVDQVAQQGYGSKGNNIHYSGPLLHPSGNVDQMLKEHDRQIQELFRRARHDKSKVRKLQGKRSQFDSRPNSSGVIPVYPSSRASSTSVFTSNRGSLQ